MGPIPIYQSPLPILMLDRTKTFPMPSGSSAMARTLNLHALSGYGIVIPVGVLDTDSQTDP